MFLAISAPRLHIKYIAASGMSSSITRWLLFVLLFGSGSFCFIWPVSNAIKHNEPADCVADCARGLSAVNFNNSVVSPIVAQKYWWRPESRRAQNAGFRVSGGHGNG